MKKGRDGKRRRDVMGREEEVLIEVQESDLVILYSYTARGCVPLESNKRAYSTWDNLASIYSNPRRPSHLHRSISQRRWPPTPFSLVSEIAAFIAV